jgi:hypothetical protein
VCEIRTEKPLEDDFQRKNVTDDVLELTTVKFRESDPNNSLQVVKMNITADACLLFILHLEVHNIC